MDIKRAPDLGRAPRAACADETKPISDKTSFFFLLRGDRGHDPLCLMARVGLGPTADGLLELVVSLNKELNHEDAAIRTKNHQRLADELAKLPDGALAPHQARSLLDFFIARLEDPPSISPAASALSNLVSATSDLSAETMDGLKRALFSVHMPGLTWRVRNDVLKLAAALLEKHSTHERLQLNFVAGIAGLVEGEKDPRNLLFGFGLAGDSIRRFPNDDSLDEIFDILSCYFPIT